MDNPLEETDATASADVPHVSKGASVGGPAIAQVPGRPETRGDTDDEEVRKAIALSLRESAARNDSPRAPPLKRAHASPLAPSGDCEDDADLRAAVELAELFGGARKRTKRTGEFGGAAGNGNGNGNGDGNGDEAAGSEDDGTGSESEEQIVPPTESSETSASYVLQAIVQHKGTGVDGGHYITDVRKGVNKWIRYDDSRVTVATDLTALGSDAQKQGYLFFFLREELAPAELKTAKSPAVAPAAASISTATATATSTSTSSAATSTSSASQSLLSVTAHKPPHGTSSASQSLLSVTAHKPPNNKSSNNGSARAPVHVIDISDRDSSSSPVPTPKPKAKSAWLSPSPSPSSSSSSQLKRSSPSAQTSGPLAAAGARTFDSAHKAAVPLTLLGKPRYGQLAINQVR